MVNVKSLAEPDNPARPILQIAAAISLSRLDQQNSSELPLQSRYETKESFICRAG